MPDEVADIWAEVLPWVERSLEYSDGRYHAADVLTRLMNGEFQLWLHPLGIVVTTIGVYRHVDGGETKVCTILLCAGERLHKWLGDLDIIKAWAKAHGCSSLSLNGRRGWKKTLGDGWQSHVSMTYRLDNGE